MPGPTELLIIAFIIILMFGARKLPELAQGLGKGIREFKKAASEVDEVTRLEETSGDQTASKKTD